MLGHAGLNTKEKLTQIRLAEALHIHRVDLKAQPHYDPGDLSCELQRGGIDDLRGTCNDLEQYSRRSALRSDMHTASLQRAVSHSQGENTYIIVTKVAEVMGIDLEIDEISVSHRLKTSKSYHGRNAKPPPIIAKFVRCNTKENSAKQGKLCTQTPFWPKSLGSAMSQRARSLL